MYGMSAFVSLDGMVVFNLVLIGMVFFFLSLITINILLDSNFLSSFFFKYDYRFKHINTAARNVLVQGGYIITDSKKKSK